MKIFRKLLKKRVLRVKKDRRTSIDSSGFSIKSSSKWYDVGIGKEKLKRDYFGTSFARRR